MEFTHVLFFLLVDAKSLICAIFERLLFSHFLKEKKNNLTSLRSSEKSNRFSDTKGLSKRDWGLEKLSFFFCSSRHFDEWELFPFGCIISHLQRATFVHQWNFVGYTGKSSLHIGQEINFTQKKYSYILLLLSSEQTTQIWQKT